MKNFVSQDKSEQVDRSKKQTSKKSVPQVEDQSNILTGTESELVQKEDEDDIYTGTCTESGLPPVKNLDPNNNDFNNTNLNKTRKDH